MSKLNLLVSLSAYEDSNATNNPAMNAIKWTRQVNSITASEPNDTVSSVAPGQTVTVFSEVSALSQDNTTTYGLALKTGSLSTYILDHNSGTAPVFRTRRILLSDATTTVAITKSGPLATLTATAGTLPAFVVSGVIAGDVVVLGDIFAEPNQGTFTILSVTATTISFKNSDALAETVVLGATFATDMRIFSSTGVQAGSKVVLPSAFSLAAGTYEITKVQDDFIEFYSTETLPELPSTLAQITIYASSKRLVYFESSKKVSVAINGASQEVSSMDGSLPGMLLLTNPVHSFAVTNLDTEVANIYFASVE